VIKQLIRRDHVIAGLMRAVHQGNLLVEQVPATLHLVLSESMWRKRQVDQLGGEVVEFKHFEDFVRAPIPQGLGLEPAALRRLLPADDRELLDMYDQAVGHNQGKRTDLLNNVQEVAAAPAGNSAQRALRRLRTARPDLHARVLARDLSPHAAMVEAGFLRPTFTVPQDVRGAARVLTRRFSAVEVEALIRELGATQLNGVADHM